MDDSPLIASRNEPRTKQGSRILCCNDSKRATILWNTLNIIFAAILMALWIVENKVDGVEEKTMSVEAAAHLDKDFIQVVVPTAIAIAMSGLAILGAMKYDRYLVLFPLVWNVIYLILLLVALIPLSGIKKDPDGGLENDRAGDQYDLVWIFIVIPIVLVIMMTYSMYVLAQEIKNNIMSAETYEREKVACCC